MTRILNLDYFEGLYYLSLSGSHTIYPENRCPYIISNVYYRTFSLFSILNFIVRVLFFPYPDTVFWCEIY